MYHGDRLHGTDRTRRTRHAATRRNPDDSLLLLLAAAGAAYWYVTKEKKDGEDPGTSGQFGQIDVQFS